VADIIIETYVIKIVTSMNIFVSMRNLRRAGFSLSIGSLFISDYILWGSQILA